MPEPTDTSTLETTAAKSATTQRENTGPEHPASTATLIARLARGATRTNAPPARTPGPLSGSTTQETTTVITAMSATRNSTLRTLAKTATQPARPAVAQPTPSASHATPEPTDTFTRETTAVKYAPLETTGLLTLAPLAMEPALLAQQQEIPVV